MITIFGSNVCYYLGGGGTFFSVSEIRAFPALSFILVVAIHPC
jgi:hypothetical protein